MHYPRRRSWNQGFADVAGLYWLWPRLTGGRHLNAILGKLHIALTYLAFNGTFGLMHLLGILGMPRRYAEPTKIDMFEHLAWAQQGDESPAIVLGAAQLLLMMNMLFSSIRGTRRREGARVRKGAEGVE